MSLYFDFYVIVFLVIFFLLVKFLIYKNVLVQVWGLLININPNWFMFMIYAGVEKYYIFLLLESPKSFFIYPPQKVMKKLLWYIS